MGNDCFLTCMKCNDKLSLGRAYHYNADEVNKKLDPKTLEKLLLAIKRFEVSLRQIPFMGEGYEVPFYEEMIEFLQTHEGHDVWFIDDYYDSKKE